MLQTIREGHQEKPSRNSKSRVPTLYFSFFNLLHRAISSAGMGWHAMCLVGKWGETFHSWLMEAKWSKSGGAPPTQEYLDVGMTSIAAHILVLPSSCLASPTTPLHQLWSNAYQPITKLLMVITRLLNDIQSYEAKFLMLDSISWGYLNCWIW